MTNHDDTTIRSDEPFVPSPAAALPPGTRIDHFEVQSLLGRGGMGQVYLALDHRLSRNVAIKFLPVSLNEDRERLARFEIEALAASALNHPNIVTIYNSGESDWGPYIVMELIQGRTLRELIHEGIPMERMLSLALQTVEATSAAHQAGIIHRDLKPDNILIRDDGYVKIVDFGLARLINVDPDATVTTTGKVMGTLKYLSPEQGRGEPVDDRSDVFALGLILYQMATGRHPFAAATGLETFRAIAVDAAVPPSRWNPEIPGALETLILSMLEKSPTSRPSAAEVVETLKAVLAGETRTLAITPVARQVFSRAVVGRTAESDVLLNAFAMAEAGHGGLVCIAGEAGMGKSTLVDSFLHRLTSDERLCLVGRGRSSKPLAGSEAFVPVIEALREQLQSDRSGRVAREMKLSAPSWYSLVTAVAGSAESPLPRANSQDRMKQELVAFLQRVGREAPLILIFEDVHWADISTVDAVVHLSDRFADLRLMVILTYRKSELLQGEHPFVTAELNMRARGASREIVLGLLSRPLVERYIGMMFEKNSFPPELLDKIYKRTGGHPLFVADLIRYLRESGALIEEGGVWELAPTFEELESRLPESVRSMVERKMSALEDEDRRLLSAAAVQGDDFETDALAAALQKDPAEVEEQLDILERVHGLVGLIDEGELPDRTLTCRYRFAHTLYQDYCVGLLRPTRRASICGVTARRIEQCYGSRAHEVASKLAVLFEGAREFARAGEYFLAASRNATSLFAHRESSAMAQRGLEALRSLPAAADRDRLELSLQLALGGSLCMTSGYANPETMACYSRAWELAEQLGDDVQGLTLWALWMTSAATGDCAKSRELSERLLRISSNAQDPLLMAAALYACAITAEGAGDMAAARTNTEALMALPALETNRHRMARLVVDPLVSARGINLRVLALMGATDLAAQRWQENLAQLDQDDLDPRSACDVLITGCCYYAFLRRPQDVQRLAKRATEICEQYDIFLERQWVSFWHGWAQSEMGMGREGLEAMQGFVALMITGIGFLMHHSLFIAPYAEALARSGEREDARHWIEQGLALVARTGQHYLESELYRIRGELEALPGGSRDKAHQLLSRALDLATAQGALLLEMRAALSLGRLLMQEGRAADAVRVLSGSLERMIEGFESPEFLEARAVCQELSQSAGHAEGGPAAEDTHG